MGCSGATARTAQGAVNVRLQCFRIQIRMVQDFHLLGPLHRAHATHVPSRQRPHQREAGSFGPEQWVDLHAAVGSGPKPIARPPQLPTIMTPARSGRASSLHESCNTTHSTPERHSRSDQPTPRRIWLHAANGFSRSIRFASNLRFRTDSIESKIFHKTNGKP